MMAWTGQLNFPSWKIALSQILKALPGDEDHH